MADYALGLLLSFFAGLATGIGAFLTISIKDFKKKYLTLGLGVSGGVMIYISFVEMLPHAINNIGELNAVLFLFGGFILMFLIDTSIPEQKNPHHFDKINHEIECQTKEQSNQLHEDMKLKRTGILAALAIGNHNFPEGIATFVATLENPEWGFMIAVAVAIHNIPEGVSVAMPIQYATKDKKKAFLYSFFSGLAEPFGAFLAFLILMPILTPAILSGIMAAIAGIMIYISVDEIIPIAHSYNEGHWALVGFLLGMLLMAITLLLL
jgi:ZIP family zinc transporter